MHASVILIHNLPDGSSHFDWFIDQPELEVEHRLISFRCQSRPDTLGLSEFAAERLPDHRADYLTYEGPISKNRGFVQRIATGTVIKLDQTAHSISVLVQWTSQESTPLVSYQAHQDPTNPTLWKFTQHTPNSSLDA